MKDLTIASDNIQIIEENMINFYLNLESRRPMYGSHFQKPLIKIEKINYIKTHRHKHTCPWKKTILK